MIYPCNRHPASGIRYLVSGIWYLASRILYLLSALFPGLPFRFHRRVLHLGRQAMPQVFFDPGMHAIDHGGEQYRHHKFVNIVAGSGYQHLVQAPGIALPGLYAFTNIEGNEKNHETINQLRNKRGAGCPEPDAFFAGDFFDAVENKYIQHLPYQERDHGTDDDPHALPEYTPECRIGFIDPVTDRKIFRRGKRNGPVEDEEGVTDQADGEVGKKFHAAGSIVFIDDIGHHKHQGPEQDPGSKVKTERATKKIDIGPLHPNGILEREYLYADHFGKQGAGDEDTGEQDKKFGAFVFKNVVYYSPCLRKK